MSLAALGTALGAPSLGFGFLRLLIEIEGDLLGFGADAKEVVDDFLGNWGLVDLRIGADADHLCDQFVMDLAEVAEGLSIQGGISLNGLNVRTDVVGILSNRISDLAVGLSEHILGLDAFDIALVAWDLGSLHLGKLLLCLLLDMSRDVAGVAWDDVGVVVTV